ncbi:MAG: hypothetical protein N3F66_14565, partial [Spirochaetes bacterium]|nr:hypothetical protein [Spirochaetota bacterium]
MKSRATQYDFIKYLNQPVLIFSKSGAIVTWNSAMAHIASLPDKKSDATVDTVFEDAARLYAAIQLMNSKHTSENINGLLLRESREALSG